MKSTDTRCGFIAILGAPNVGKSTLLNRIVGAKVSIVSPKVQTTRTRVLGIAIEGNAQLIFIDTPGIFAPRRRLDRAMVAAAWSGVGDAERILLLVDSERGFDTNTKAIIDRMAGSNQKADLVLNKVDLVQKTDLLSLTMQLNETGICNEIFMISAKKGNGVVDLVDYLRDSVKESPWLFPEDQISDMPMRLLAAEITREKIYLKLHKELPYATTVETENWQEEDDGSVRIEQVIFVERNSQKAIVLGKKGRQIKTIGSDARAELEKLLEQRVHLFLFVKVREKWGDDPARYRDWGWDFNA